MAIGLVILLGILQGLTEFLPVSSSGHLRILSELFEVEDPQTLFDILLHVGSLVAVVVVYRELFGKMTIALLRVARRPRALADEPHARLALLACVGTVPTGLIAIALGDLMEGWSSSIIFVGSMLLLNGAMLLLLGRLSRNVSVLGRRAQRGVAGMTVFDALFIGTVQGMGIFRGISRSGSTITAGLLVGLDQQTAAAFSFVLSVPAILGALVLKMDFAAIQADGLGIYLLGAGVAAVVGTVALLLLLRLLNRGQLHHFAWYCFALGLFAIMYPSL